MFNSWAEDSMRSLTIDIFLFDFWNGMVAIYFC